MIGIICPSAFEARYLRDLRIPASRAALVVSGMGKVRALHACHMLWRAHPRLNRLLLIGYAGSLSDALQIGDLVEPDVFLEYDYDARPFERFPNTIRLKTGPRLAADSKRAAMVTQDRFLKTNPLAGTPLGKKHPALACDMESYAVAHFGIMTGVPVTVLKLISDRADVKADHDFLKACRDLAPRLKTTTLQVLDRLKNK